MARLPAIDRLSAESAEFLAASPDKTAPREYRMVGYTGAEFGRYFGRVVIDLAGMAIEKSLPAFGEHNRDQRIGYGTGKIEGGKLLIQGRLLSNECAQSYAADAAEGFPFQASIGVEYLRIEEIQDGDSKTVNGKSFKGPGYVVTKSRVRECSPVALGADNKTCTEFMARSGGPEIEVETPTKETLMADPSQDVATDRARVKAISEALKDHPEVALLAITAGDSLAEAKARLVEKLSAENAAMKLKNDKLERAAASPPVGFAGAAREAAGAAPASGAPAAEDLSTLSFDDRAKKNWETSAELRKEFEGLGENDGGFACYRAYLKAEEKRLVAIKSVNGTITR